MPNIDDAKQVGPHRKVLYGLPCAQCKVYYAADLTSCPVRQSRERVPALGATKLPSASGAL
jgi:hypothetical protein